MCRAFFFLHLRMAGWYFIKNFPKWWWIFCVIFPCALTFKCKLLSSRICVTSVVNISTDEIQTPDRKIQTTFSRRWVKIWCACLSWLSSACWTQTAFQSDQSIQFLRMLDSLNISHETVISLKPSKNSYFSYSRNTVPARDLDIFPASHIFPSFWNRSLQFKNLVIVKPLPKTNYQASILSDFNVKVNNKELAFTSFVPSLFIVAHT